MLTKERDILEFGLCMIDIISVLISVYLVVLYPNSSITEVTPIVLVFIHIASFYMSNCFKHFYRRGYFEEFRALSYYSFNMIISISLFIFLTKEVIFISRRGMILFIPLNFMLCYITHILVKMYSNTKSHQSHGKKVFLITTMDRLDSIVERLTNAKSWGGSITAVAIADNFNLEADFMKSYFPEATLVGWDIIEEYAIQNVVDEVFINLSRDLDDLAVALVKKFEVMGFDISMNIRSFDVPSNTTKKVRTLAGFQVVTFSHVFHNEGEVLLKRVMDILGGMVGLIITFFVSILLIPLIMIESPGNPIYSQNRVGKNGRIFKFYKFRSMYKDADKIKEKLLKNNTMDGLMFKMDDDPRITKVGKFIRKTSIDELPQFYNVLKGDMSLVGTRPPTEDEYRKYSAHHKKRLSFKPGITGLWQVSGRSEITDFDEVVKLDVEYITNWSIWLDVKILLLTLKVVFLGRGAK